MPKSKREFWSQKFEANVLRDKNNLSLLKKAGWLPIVVWECEIKHDATATLGSVSRVLQRHLKKLAAA